MNCSIGIGINIEHLRNMGSSVDIVSSNVGIDLRTIGIVCTNLRGIGIDLERGFNLVSRLRSIGGLCGRMSIGIEQLLDTYVKAESLGVLRGSDRVAKD